MIVVNKNQKITLGGNTLMELLVVIGVIGVLAVAIQFTLDPLGQFKKGRDAQRKHSLDLFKSPLEEYNTDFGRYPISTPDNKLPSDFLTYMKTQPKDPINTQTYAYQTDISGTYYRVYAKLERCSNDPQVITGVNCNSDPYNYCVSSSNIACSLFAVIPPPPPPPPPISGCADGTTGQDFGTTPVGKKVHGCNNNALYASAGTLCAAGWHVGDVVLDSGLATLLGGTPGNDSRWVHMNGDPGSFTGTNGTSDVFCWGTLSASCTSPVATPNSSRPVHLSTTSGPTGIVGPIYLNGVKVLSNNGNVWITPGFPGIGQAGAICVEN